MMEQALPTGSEWLHQGIMQLDKTENPPAAVRVGSSGNVFRGSFKIKHGSDLSDADSTRCSARSLDGLPAECKGEPEDRQPLNARQGRCGLSLRGHAPAERFATGDEREVWESRPAAATAARTVAWASFGDQADPALGIGPGQIGQGEHAAIWSEPRRTRAGEAIVIIGHPPRPKPAFSFVDFMSE